MSKRIKDDQPNLEIQTFPNGRYYISLSMCTTKIVDIDTSLPILAYTETFHQGTIPLVLRWFKYNGIEAWRDADGGSHIPTRWLLIDKNIVRYPCKLIKTYE